MPFKPWLMPVSVLEAFRERFGATEAQAREFLGWAYKDIFVKMPEDPSGARPYAFVEKYAWPFVMQSRSLFRLGEKPEYLNNDSDITRLKISPEDYAAVAARFTADIMAFLREHHATVRPDVPLD